MSQDLHVPWSSWLNQVYREEALAFGRTSDVEWRALLACMDERPDLQTRVVDEVVAIMTAMPFELGETIKQILRDPDAWAMQNDL